MNIYDKLNDIYKNMEYSYKESEDDRVIISGYVGGYWCRLTYFFVKEILIVTNISYTEDSIIKYSKRRGYYVVDRKDVCVIEEKESEKRNKKKGRNSRDMEVIKWSSKRIKGEKVKEER